MKTKTLRIIIPIAVLAIIGVGFVLNSGIGSLSALGWKDVSLLCPLGALSTMIATKTLIPRALVSLVLASAAIIVLGRAFCAWICPVPVVSKLRDAFKKKRSGEREPNDEAPGENGGLTPEEKKLLKRSCASCGQMRVSQPAKIDSRHFVLGGSLLSAAIFGFPVFCLVCPIGLTFATITLVVLLFSGGDVTWSLIVIPALLIAEVVVLRKWCANFCPLSALMSLIAKANRTFKPTIDNAKCLEKANGVTCDLCGTSCEVGIDVRHPERGASWSECTKCRACVDACPAHAISMPLLPKAANDADASSHDKAASRREEIAEAK